MQVNYQTGMTSELPAVTGVLDIIEHNENAVNPPSSKLVPTLSNVAFATLASRITGFLRTLLIGIIIAIPATRSAFTTANSLPNQIAALALDAVLASVVVPVLVQAEKDDKDGGKGFFDKLTTMSLVILCLALAISLALVPVFIPWLTQGLDNDHLAEFLAFLLLPQIIFYGLTSLFSAALNMRGYFVAAAWAPVLNNIIGIAVLIIYHFLPGSPLDFTHILVLGVGTTIGVVAQAVVLLPLLYKINFLPKWSWGIDDRLKNFGRLAAAIVCYVAISQLGLYLTLPLASHISKNGPFTYFTSWQFLQVPYGVLGLTILTTITPDISRAAASRLYSDLRSKYRLSTFLSFFLLILPVAFLTLFGSTITQILFGFSTDNSIDVGQAISWSAFTILPYACVLIQLRIFYALNYAFTPILIIIFITASRIGLNYVGTLFLHDKHLVSWLCLSNGGSFIIGALVGSICLRTLLKGPTMRRGDTSVVIVISSLAFTLCAGALAAFHYSGIQQHHSLWIYLLSITFLFMVILVLFGLLCYVTKAYRVINFSQLSFKLSSVTRRIHRFLPAQFSPSLPVVPDVSPGDSLPQHPVPSVASYARDYSFRSYISGEQFGIPYWRTYNEKFKRDNGVLIAAQERHLSSLLLQLAERETSAVVRTVDVIDVPETQQELIITQWISSLDLHTAYLHKPNFTQIMNAVEGLALTINYAHADGVTLGLNDPSAVVFTHTGRCILTQPVLPHHTYDDIRGLASIIYCLLTGHWPYNFFPQIPWNSPLPVAASSVHELPPITHFVPDFPPGIEKIILDAIKLPQNTRYAINLITMINDQAKTHFAQWHMDEEPPVRTGEKFTDSSHEFNPKVHFSTLTIILALFIAIITGIFAWGFSNYSSNTAQESVSKLFKHRDDAQGARSPVHFTVDSLVDYTNDPSTLDKTYIQNLPHIASGKAPAWQTDVYRKDDLSRAKNPSNGVGIVLKLNHPSPVHKIVIASPSQGAQLEIYNYNPQAKSTDDLTLLHKSVSIAGKNTTLTLPGGSAQSSLLVWITHLAQSDNGYSASIERISLFS